VSLSKDEGNSWTQANNPAVWGLSMATSADGSRLIAAGNSVFTSTDSGATWVSNNAPVTDWSAVASSADGAKLVAVVSGGGIYTWQATPTPVLEFTYFEGDLLLSWTVPSMNFALQQSPDLASGKWATVTVTPTLNYTNLQYQVGIPKPQGTMFYRLAAQ